VICCALFSLSVRISVGLSHSPSVPKRVNHIDIMNALQTRISEAFQKSGAYGTGFPDQVSTVAVGMTIAAPAQTSEVMAVLRNTREERSGLASFVASYAARSNMTLMNRTCAAILPFDNHRTWPLRIMCIALQP
jgi:hypothetical protein